MGRDWTPKEFYYADIHAKMTRGTALRDEDIVLVNQKTGEKTPLVSTEEKEIGKLFPEISFLFDSFFKMYNKYSEYPDERDMLFLYIEAALYNAENDIQSDFDNIYFTAKEVLAKNEKLLYNVSDIELHDKLYAMHQEFPTRMMEKWFDGALSPTFYYNTQNNECLMDEIDNAMTVMVQRKAKEFERGSTHSTIFHADEVFTTALMKLINPDFEYERNLDIPDDPDILVYDKGRGKYDHHQEGNEVRPNGIPYASFGKVWRDFSKYLAIDGRLTTKAERDIVEKRLVQKIDAVDNGLGRDEISSYIGLLNPINRPGKVEEKENEMFEKAVAFAMDVIERNLERSVELGRQVEILKQDIAKDKNINNGVLSLSDYVTIAESNIYDILTEKNIELVVYPSSRGGYNVQQVPTELGGFVGKLPFPQTWLGKPANELPEHITFCHSGNWLLAIDSTTRKEAFEMACKIADISREELKKDIGRESDDTLR